MSSFSGHGLVVLVLYAVVCPPQFASGIVTCIPGSSKYTPYVAGTYSKPETTRGTRVLPAQSCREGQEFTCNTSNTLFQFNTSRVVKIREYHHTMSGTHFSGEFLYFTPVLLPVAALLCIYCIQLKGKRTGEPATQALPLAEEEAGTSMLQRSEDCRQLLTDLSTQQLQAMLSSLGPGGTALTFPSPSEDHCRHELMERISCYTSRDQLAAALRTMAQASSTDDAVSPRSASLSYKNKLRPRPPSPSTSLPSGPDHPSHTQTVVARHVVTCDSLPASEEDEREMPGPMRAEEAGSKDKVSRGSFDSVSSFTFVKTLAGRGRSLPPEADENVASPSHGTTSHNCSLSLSVLSDTEVKDIAEASCQRESSVNENGRAGWSHTSLKRHHTIKTRLQTSKKRHQTSKKERHWSSQTDLKTAGTTAHDDPTADTTSETAQQAEEDQQSSQASEEKSHSIQEKNLLRTPELTRHDHEEWSSDLLGSSDEDFGNEIDPLLPGFGGEPSLRLACQSNAFAVKRFSSECDVHIHGNASTENPGVSSVVTSSNTSAKSVFCSVQSHSCLTEESDFCSAENPTTSSEISDPCSIANPSNDSSVQSVFSVGNPLSASSQRQDLCFVSNLSAASSECPPVSSLEIPPGRSAEMADLCSVQNPSGGSAECSSLCSIENPSNSSLHTLNLCSVENSSNPATHGSNLCSVENPSNTSSELSIFCSAENTTNGASSESTNTEIPETFEEDDDDERISLFSVQNPSNASTEHP